MLVNLPPTVPSAIVVLPVVFISVSTVDAKVVISAVFESIFIAFDSISFITTLFAESISVSPVTASLFVTCVLFEVFV